ncbi:MAG: hypothetical protein ACRBFS_04690, partial [Aureispira sp.]
MPSFYSSILHRIIWCVIFLVLCPTLSFGQTSTIDSFSNSNTNAPTAIWEACAGDEVSFAYAGFSLHPHLVRLNDNAGNLIDIPVVNNPDTIINNQRQGISTFTIPNNAVSGVVTFVNTNNNTATTLHTTTQLLIIHSPVVDFLTQTAPICAKNQIDTLYGFPSGGIFTVDTAKIVSNFIDSIVFNATLAPWPPHHYKDSMVVNITYGYTPSYTNGTTCPQSKDTTKSITIYDNRLDWIEYDTLIRLAAGASNQFLSLDTSLSTMITGLSHDIFCNSNSSTPHVTCYPHSFSGAFVTPSDSFLSPIAANNNLLRLEYNNNGCIGSATSALVIVDSFLTPKIIGLPDTLCQGASPITLERDSSLVYSRDTTGNLLTGRIITIDSLVSVTTLDPMHQAAIIPNTNNPTSLGQEIYDFDPSLLPMGTSKVILTMEYYTINAPRSSFGSPSDTSILHVIDSVVIRQAPTPAMATIGNLNSSYCQNDPTDTLTLAYDTLGPNNNSTYITLSGGINQIDLLNNTFDPTFLYDTLTHSTIGVVGNPQLLLYYEIDYYGCTVTSSANIIQITAPLTPAITDSSYCNNNTITTLAHSTPTGSITKLFTTIPSLPNAITDPTTGEFDPSLAALDTNIILYTQTDATGTCSYSDTAVIIITAAPQVQLTLDSSLIDTMFCINESNIQLGVFVQANTGTGFLPYNSVYSGAGVTNNIFDPSSVFVGVGGDTTLYVSTTDSLGCIGTDSIGVIIKDLPISLIDGAFNGVPSPYGTNNLDTSDHTYSRNAAPLSIDGQPSHATGLAGTTITGMGVSYQVSNNKYYYSPSLVSSTLDVDMVIYTYVDSMGCMAMDSTIIKLDNIPTTFPTVTFNNSTASQAPTYEACVGDSVSFDYDAFMMHPDKIQFRNQIGALVDLPVTSTNQVTNTNNSVKGTIAFRLPNTAATGTISFWNGSDSLYTTQILYIHNPVLDFLPQTTPLCADDIAIPLIGSPSGGVFTADPSQVDSSFITGSTINATQAKWPINHAGSIGVDVTYYYFPQYSNGTTCADSINTMKQLTFYDNRLDQISFATIIKQTSGGNNRLLTLDSTSNNNIITQIIPNILCDPTSCYNHTFSGTYVDQNSNFLGDLANTNNTNSVHLEFNNNGCIGEVSGDITVNDFSNIYELPDKLCRQSHSSDVINREPNFRYSSIPFPTVTIIKNNLESITANNIPIQLVDSTKGSETFQIHLDSFRNTDTIIVTITYLDKNINSTITNSSAVIVNSIVITDTILIVDRPSNTLADVPNYFCANDVIDTLTLLPDLNHDSLSFLAFSYLDPNSNRYQTNSIYTNIISPKAIYDSLSSTTNQNVFIWLSYHSDYYGCYSSGFKSINIVAPLDPTFSTRPTYCKSAAPETFLSLQPRGTQSYFQPIPGLDSSGHFTPQLADTGSNFITYVLIDTTYDCTYQSTDTITISAPPRIALTLDGLEADTTLCANTPAKIISYRTISGTIDSFSVSGLGVSNNTFTPPPSLATATITATVKDTITGCIGSDDLIVDIVVLPNVDIQTTFNAQSNSNSISFCKNDSVFTIIPQPIPSTAMSYSLIGNGIIDSNNIYTYDPSSIILAGDTIDQVIYTYTDNNGCSAIDTAIIKLDTVPMVSINHSMDTSFCLNDTAIFFIVSPNSTGIGAYQGAGINTTTGLFSPSLASVNTHSISYNFTDSKGCSAEDAIQVTVHPLPIPTFTGDSSQYCISAPNDILYSSNHPSGQFSFYGELVIDSTGIISPSSDTTTAGTGTKPIYYTYTDSLGCSDTISRNIFIHPGPTILIAGLDSAYCSKDSKDFISLEPQGGTFTGNNTNTFAIDSTGFLTFTPNTDTGYKSFTYIYKDGNDCSDTISARTYIHNPSSSIINNLDSFYCRVNDTIRITGSPIGGTFSGSGIDFDSTWYFIPNKAGLGRNAIRYSINDTLAQPMQNLLICPIDTVIEIEISKLPVPLLTSPTLNQRFCSSDTLQQLLPDSSVIGYWHHFTNNSGGVYLDIFIDTIFYPNNQYVIFTDTSFYFNPNAVGDGIHSVTHTVTDSVGCTASTTTSFIVDAYQSSDFNLAPAHCEADTAIQIYTTSGGGSFTRNGIPLIRSIQTSNFYFHPNSGRRDTSNRLIPLTTDSITVNITHTITNNACSDSTTKNITVYRIPSISFTTDSSHNTYCIGGDTVWLTSVDTGGIFSGNGVRQGTNYFLPDLAGPGYHPIHFEYQTPITGCRSQFIDTINVYGMPEIGFSVLGGCQQDSSYFLPDSITTLSSIFRNNSIDQITHIQWQADSNNSFIINSSQIDTINNQIAPFAYSYNSPGVYYPSLIVANRTHCIDTHTIRIVISPVVNNYPYEQDFEASAGNWFAESRTSNNSLLWEWGVDNNPLGVAQDTSNHIWATQTDRGYGPEEDAWVYSPCFDISSLNRPMISLDYWTDTRQQADGSILEYQKTDGSWAPVGELNRGINWFNTPFIAGDPGDNTHRVFPIGWSGESNSWQNGRYKLDAYRGINNIVRLRIAFASVTVDPMRDYDGFAFDNVVIRNRTRNVLLETMANASYNNMENINNYVYQLIHHTNLNKDVVMLQYHIENANNNGTDAFNLHNPSLGDTRAFEYNGSPIGRSFIDGLDSNTTYTSFNLSDTDFEQDMLETP